MYNFLLTPTCVSMSVQILHTGQIIQGNKLPHKGFFFFFLFHPQHLVQIHPLNFCLKLKAFSFLLSISIKISLCINKSTTVMFPLIRVVYEVAKLLLKTQ